MHTRNLPACAVPNNQRSFKHRFFLFQHFFSGRSKTVFILFAGVLFNATGFSQNVVLTNPSSPFIVPVGVTSLKIEVWGGGGAGGGSQNTFLTARYGGGGGGGGYSVSTFAVTAGQSYTITKGAGGIAASNANGGNGGSSLVSGPGGAVSAGGGAGGVKSTASTGGAGGTGSTFSGGAGGTGTSNGAGGGGGAGNAGNGSAGANTGTAAGGTGNPNVAPYKGGNGGAAQTSATNDGSDGIAPGGGGGGGKSNTATSAGGDGGAGQVVITYTCPTYSLTNPATATSPVCGNSASTITVSSSATGLPAGIYTVTYNLSAPNAATGLTASMNVTTAGSGSFATAALVNGGSTTLTITSLALTSAGCTSTIASNNTAIITVNAVSVFSVTGGGAYCSGGTGVSILLSGSQSGVNYKLLNGATTVTTLAGTGAALSFVNVTAAGTYTIQGTNVTTLCSATMTGSAVISINAVPSITSVVAAPSTVCSGSISTITATPVFVAATPSLGSGTSTTSGAVSTSALGPDPFEDYYGGAKQQMLITAAELTSMGLANGSQISALQIQLATANTSYTLLNYTVRIQHTALTALTSTFTTSGFTNVYGPSSYTPSTGYNNLAFSTNFTWNGTSNLLIETSYSNANTGDDGVTTAYYGSTSFVSTAFYRVDNASAASLLSQATATATYSARNNIKLTATVPPAITWTPITQLYSNAAATTAYIIGANALVVYAKPTATRIYTATATNSVGCTATATATVTVNDPAAIVTPPSGQVACAGSSASFTVVASGTNPTYQWRKGTVNLTNTANITGVTSATLTINPVSASDAASTYNVVVTSASPCTATVTSANVSLTVNTTPVITCPANVIVNTDPNVCQATKTYAATVTGSPTPTLSYSVGGNAISFPYAFPKGVTTVNVAASNTCAPNASCSFTVTVVDAQAPVIPVLANVTGECSATASAPTTTDNCSGTITGTTADALTYNAQGTHVIHWSFSDENGNTSTQTQNVIIHDITVPVPNVSSLPSVSGECSASVTAPSATDNCSGAITGTTADPLQYHVPGNYTIHWSYNDGNGNVSTQNQNVTVTDVNAPVPNMAVLPDLTGQCSATATAPSATDACVGIIQGTTTDPVSYSSQGMYVIHWTYNDGHGNISTQNQNVIIHDATAPAPTLPVLPNITGECSATAPAPVATDNCAGNITGTTSDPVSYNIQGTYTIHWSYNDGNGNVSTQEQTVIVQDLTAPVANVAVLPTVTGECGASVSAPSATDNCIGSIAGTTTDPVSYSTQGTYTIHWTYNDGNGNVSTQQQTVIVHDVTAPVADAASLSAITGECSAGVSVAPTATDNCAGAITATTTDPLTYNGQGTYTIHWSYNDGNGNVSTQTQTVVVDDITAPVPDVTSLEPVTGECLATVTSTPTATDNCVGSVNGTTTDPLTYSSQGTHTIHWTFDDGNGNVSTQTQVVIIHDITVPVPDITDLPNLAGECSISVSSPVATDNCAGNITGSTADPVTYNVPGNYIIHWNYDDGNGNVATQTQNVTVTDVNAPVPDLAILPVLTAECTVTATAPTATDACSGLVIATTGDPLTYDSQGTFTIHWSYNDGHGNVSTQDQTVIISDATAPVADVANLPALNAECSLTLTAPTATDNCTGQVNATTIDPLTYNIQGTYTVNWIYSDGHGNTSGQTQTVIIHDITAPVADVANLPNATGECSVTVSAPHATDNCAGAVSATTADPLTYAAQGTYTILWTYNDGNGNTSTQVQTVVVNDVTAPVISCPAAQTFCATAGNNFAIPLLAATDNCTISSIGYQVSGATIRSGSGNNASGVFNAGVSTITWTVTDGNNNSSTCSTVVTVNIPPATPGLVSGITNVCPYIGTGQQLTYTIDAVPNAQGYQWIVVPSAITIVSGQGTTSLTVTINGGFDTSLLSSKRLRVKALSACGNSAERIFYLTAQFPSTPGFITGPTSICNLIGTSNTATYKINKVLSATSYAWGTAANTTSVIHPNGPGENDTVIVVTYASNYASSSITVAAVNLCGTSGSVRSLSVPRNAPSLPGLISGPTNVCAYIAPNGASATYSIVSIAGALSYTWAVPANAVVNHPNAAGANDTVITVRYPANFSSGAITVSVTNGCGTSGLRSLNITKLNPATPSVIDVIQTQACPNRIYSYTLSAMPANATSIQWTIPAGATLVSQSAISISVSYPSTSVQGNVTAQSVNNCASSSIRSSVVKLPACEETPPPPPPFGRTGSIAYDKKINQPLPLVAELIEVKVYPNPSTSDFKLRVMTPGKEVINARILDIQGREYKSMIIIPSETISFGSDLKTGTYILELIQGKTRTTQKLVKF